MTGGGAPGGRIVKYDLPGAAVDVQHGAVAGVGRADTQHDVQLIHRITTISNQSINQSINRFIIYTTLFA